MVISLEKLFKWGYKAFSRLEYGNNKLAQIMRMCKIHVIAHKVLYFWEKWHPTEQMIKSQKFFKENEKQIERVKSLLADGFSKETYQRMIDFRQDRKKFPRYSENDIYFVKNIIKIKDNSVFIDCGAYVGDTIERFIKRYGKYKTIYAFEPDLLNCKKMQQMIMKYNWKNINILQCASWSSNTILRFTNDSFTKTGNSISEEGKTQINADSIDNILKGGVDLIKMDVEGAELESLKGAQKTILTYKPQLAICIYHSDQDMISIPLYIHELCPDYKLYVRHHTCNLSDMVLYAVAK